MQSKEPSTCAAVVAKPLYSITMGIRGNFAFIALTSRALLASGTEWNSNARPYGSKV